MIKNLLLQHKNEKETLISKEYVTRNKLNFAQKFLETDMIKVITGPRRAGKSVFAMLLLKEKDFIYLNFDDDNLLKIENSDEIIKGIYEVYSQPKYFLFDEIQNFNNWEIFINKLQRRGYNIVLTGSNAKLLSKDLATALTGRHIPIEILPFNFSEFLQFKKFNLKKEEEYLPEEKGILLYNLEEHIKNGGFPEIIVKNIDPKTYLDTLFDAILLKDVVKRYKVRFPQKLYDLSLYLISNFSSEFSFTKLKNILKFNSVNTLQNYLRYLEEAYLILSLNRFSFKTKEQIKAPKKIFLVDNGFIQAKSFQFTPNSGRLMENLVFVELLKKGYKLNENIFYYKTRNEKEIDFILKEGIQIKTILQVSLQFSDLNSQKKEINSLIEAGQELNCDDLLIITWDNNEELKVKGKKIKIIPLWKWLI